MSNKQTWFCKKSSTIAKQAPESRFQLADLEPFPLGHALQGCSQVGQF